MKPDNPSKPTDASELLAAPAPDLAALGDNEPKPALLDIKGALDRLEGDQNLFEELARLFADECPKSISQIRSALDCTDFALLERLAHTLKGSSACLGAESVRQIALELEISSRASDLPKSEKLVESLQHEIDRLIPELKAIFGAAAR